MAHFNPPILHTLLPDTTPRAGPVVPQHQTVAPKSFARALTTLCIATKRICTKEYDRKEVERHWNTRQHRHHTARAHRLDRLLRTNSMDSTGKSKVYERGSDGSLATTEATLDYTIFSRLSRTCKSLWLIAFLTVAPYSFCFTTDMMMS